jgi:hypothetical protein
VKLLQVSADGVKGGANLLHLFEADRKGLFTHRFLRLSGCRAPSVPVVDQSLRGLQMSSDNSNTSTA